ncbi:LysR family transcriptional regulator [Actinocatenispora rupis]|uniref:Transcriptional regulator n=1 Tax=Actinocatenispora rupis TaxID=519421 RepID=A0A8J3N8C4_9ACTN|nr:LysR substrate-binding domain-containing protein [Actinocatenispora rupis]GID09936.1 transcriptional regulator [Actinocatenispora rupis]
MDLTMLTQFLAVARREHLSRAADELHVAQPSLSRTIARLERELGAPLFDRAGRLRLNDTGKLFAGYVERALGELDAGRRAVAEVTRDGFGTVRLASETFLTFTGVLAAFKREYPAVDVRLNQMPAADMARHLRAREVDLCVSSQPIPTDGLVAEHLFDEQVWLGVPLDHPLADRKSVRVDELADESFVSASRRHWQRQLLDRLFAAHNRTPRIVCEGDEPSTIASLVGAGLGVGLVPGFARRIDASMPLVLVAVDDPDCRRTVTLYQGADVRLSRAARLMRTMLTEWDWFAGEPD